MTSDIVLTDAEKGALRDLAKAFREMSARELRRRAATLDRLVVCGLVSCRFPAIYGPPLYKLSNDGAALYRERGWRLDPLGK